MMRHCPWAIRLCVLLIGCSGGCSSTAPHVGVAMPSGTRPAAGMSPMVRGAGVEALVMRVEASPGEIHEALVAAGGQRDTTAMESKAGLEVITLDASPGIRTRIEVVDPPYIAP